MSEGGLQKRRGEREGATLAVGKKKKKKQKSGGQGSVKRGKILKKKKDPVGTRGVWKERSKPGPSMGGVCQGGA